MGEKYFRPFCVYSTLKICFLNTVIGEPDPQSFCYNCHPALDAGSPQKIVELFQGIPHQVQNDGKCNCHPELVSGSPVEIPKNKFGMTVIGNTVSRMVTSKKNHHSTTVTFTLSACKTPFSSS